MRSAYYMAFTTWTCTAAWAFTLGHWALGSIATLFAVGEVVDWDNTP